jgi:hypothetical protein
MIVPGFRFTGLAALLVMAMLAGGGCGGCPSPDAVPDAAVVDHGPVSGWIYQLTYKYEGGKFSPADMVVKPGSAPYRNQPRPGYKYEVLTPRGAVLGSFNFVLPELYYDYPNPQTGQMEGGVIAQKVLEGEILIPYFHNGASLCLYDPEGKKLLTVDISSLPKVMTRIVGSIIASPGAHEGKRVTIIGCYRGWDLLGETGASSPVTKSDWVIKDASGAIYVSARSSARPAGSLDPASRESTDTLLKLTGIVRVTGKGQAYLDAESIEIRS